MDTLELERQAFEAWYAEKFNAESNSELSLSPEVLATWRNGDCYDTTHHYLNGAWHGWKARAGLDDVTIAREALGELQERTGLSRAMCQEALRKARGNVNVAERDLRQAHAEHHAQRPAQEGVDRCASCGGITGHRDGCPMQAAIDATHH